MRPAHSSRIYQTIKVSSDGDVDWLMLNRPDRLNAIDPVMTAELFDYFGHVATSSCRVIVFGGAGRAFCAGLDLKDFDPTAPPPTSEAALTGVIRRMRACPQPIIGLVNGAACGGGFSLLLACDVRLASPKAKMNVAYIKLGVSGCELGTSYHLPRAVGASVANELMLTGRFIDANRSLATGLVSAVVDGDQLEEAAREMASEMLAASRIGLCKTKETIERVARVADLDGAIDLEEQAQRDCMRDPLFAAAVAAFATRA